MCKKQADTNITMDSRRDIYVMLQPGSGQVSMLKDHFVSRCSRIVLCHQLWTLGLFAFDEGVLANKSSCGNVVFHEHGHTSSYTAFHFKFGVSRAGGAYISKVGTLSVPALQVPHRIPIPILTDVALHVMQERAQPLDLVVGVPNQQGALASLVDEPSTARRLGSGADAPVSSPCFVLVDLPSPMSVVA
jgi:hypothetical protein